LKPKYKQVSRSGLLSERSSFLPRGGYVLSCGNKIVHSSGQEGASPSSHSVAIHLATPSSGSGAGLKLFPRQRNT
jgi:hypothetical protein